MAVFEMDGGMRDSLAGDLSGIIVEYSSGASLFCNIFLQIIDTDIDAVDITKFLDNDLLNCNKNTDVKDLVGIHPDMVDVEKVKQAWLQHYIPRFYVFLHGVTFSGKRLAPDLLNFIVNHLNSADIINTSLFERLIADGDKKLSWWSRKCKDANWLYDIKDMLEIINRNIIRRTKPNTIPMFMTIMNSIEPKFINDLKSNLVIRMSWYQRIEGIDPIYK